MYRTTSWDDLIARFGPIAEASRAPDDALEQAARDGRLFRVVVQRDGFGSGDVGVDVLATVPASRGLGVHQGVVWNCFFFTSPGAIEGLASAVRFGWESFGDVPGLPHGPPGAPREAAASLATLLGEREVPEWAFTLAAVDHDRELGLRVATHPLAPPRALDLLVIATDADVRVALARHQATSAATLERLSRDRVEAVREAARR
jgi:hypothetical protein